MFCTLSHAIVGRMQRGEGTQDAAGGGNREINRGAYTAEHKNPQCSAENEHCTIHVLSREKPCVVQRRLRSNVVEAHAFMSMPLPRGPGAGA